MCAIVDSVAGITLVGGAGLPPGALDQALSVAPDLVAVDGGANHLRATGHVPLSLIGDMDSVAPDLQALWGARLHVIAEQDSTDFDKALRNISAPHVIGVGFLGGRMDHSVAALTSLVRHGSARVILLGAQDVVFLAPPQLTLSLPAGTRVSLYPMAAVGGRSVGLHWPIDGLDFAPWDVIGTSNRMAAAQAQLQFDRPGMIVMLPSQHLAPVLAAVLAAPDWA